MAATAAGAGSSRRPPPAAAVGLAVVVMLMATAATPAEGFISDKTWRAIRRANRDGAPFVGLVVPNAYEMDPVLRSPSFKPSDDNPFLDVQGTCTTYVYICYYVYSTVQELVIIRAEMMSMHA
jgi:hypothetical protein